MKKITYILLICLLAFACGEEEIKYTEGSYFSLSDTHVNFDSEAGNYSVEATNMAGSLTATVVSENSEWCAATATGKTITFKVEENVLIKSRIAVVEISDGKESINVLVRQARKYFTYIPAVKNLKATAGPNKITLTWEVPEEDNFSHVIVTYTKGGQEMRIVLEAGVTECVIPELLVFDGEYTFKVQSVDKDLDVGETVSAKAIAGKLVAFRFEKDLDTQWVHYHLRTSDTYTATLRVGSAEFDEGNAITINIEIDESLLTTYNQQNATNFALLPTGTYTMPTSVAYTSTTTYQDFNIQLDVPAVGDRKKYALPLKISSVSDSQISEVMSYTVVTFYVDDLEGWYTVDRLSKNGEGAGNYPTNPADRRRYIKRTGDYTWQTGYLFRSYATSETHVTTDPNHQQNITLDPVTKVLTIMQGSLPISTNNSTFNIATNELHIEYLYRDWAGWWNHERMYNRSLKK